MLKQNPLALPEAFQKTICETFDDGAVWLENLPERLATFAARWNLTVQPAFANLSFNYVTPATLADGTPVVLKLGVPNPELTTEVVAVGLYDGKGCARLLEADAENGALLLERLKPGRMLVTLEDDEAATRIAADIMRQLWRPVPTEHPFPNLTHWTRELAELRLHFAGGTGPFPPRLIEMAETYFAELIPSQHPEVVLHGDLHHFNILTAQRAPWLAIDPKGIVGEPEYEVGAWMRNPLPQLMERVDAKAILQRRLEIFAEMLGFDKVRMQHWCVAQHVLATWWGFSEDSMAQDWETSCLDCAQAISELKFG